MAAATYRSVTCNVQKTDTAAQQKATIQKAWGYADVLKLQEGNTQATRDALASLGKDAAWANSGGIASQNPVVWRKSKFALVATGQKSSYGGKAGMSPSRGINWVVLRHIDSGESVIEISIHQIHSAFTYHPERIPIWNQIQSGSAAEMARLTGVYPGLPIVISGDMNNGGTITWPNFPMTELPTPKTHPGGRYDRFFIKGGIKPVGDIKIYDTASDHMVVATSFEITTKLAAPKPAAPTPAPVVAPTPVGAGVTLDRARRTYLRRERWRFFAQRMDGDGANGPIVHSDLPLTDVEVTDVLTGHNALTANITPQFASLMGNDGRPLLDEWKTAIWAEESGDILGGGILTKSGFNGPDWSLECTGLTGYAAGMPYTDAKFFVEADPLDIYRHVWTHLQGQPGGNIGLTIDSLQSGLKVGTVLEQVEFDTQSGPLSFEAGPIKLAWYQTADLGSFIEDLSTSTPFDWHEEHAWDGDQLTHFVRLGYPVLGRRRDDLRFVIGENVHVVPPVDRNGDDYATEALVLGAGEGSAMVRGSARRNITGGLRRVAVITSPDSRSASAANTVGARDMAWRAHLENISEIVVRKHPHADITSMRVGDEIHLQGDAGWIQVDGYYRILSRSIKPNGDGTMALSVQATDRQGT